ncbi:hypothetical protein [Amphibacillus jilinensis]|uniref:hypothetical protein n=1 Tax=Amphibacillus jilinensis TaxID=1216008 RepID=UPI0002DD1326|nr:hypothetical protein [Amphibacillus jilinensis]
MKKLFNMTIVLMVVFIFSACSNDTNASTNTNKNPNTIVDSELTDREEAILSTVSNQSFVFDFNIEDEYNEVSLWIEKYEFGELIDEQIGHFTTEVVKNGSIIFTSVESEAIQMFNIGVYSNGGTTSIITSDIVSTKGVEDRSTVWENNSEEIDVEDEEIVLASIGFSWDEDSMVSFSSEFYSDNERRIEELENYGVVYLLKSKFTK